MNSPIRKILSGVLILAAVNSGLAQDDLEHKAPTLQIGLSGLNFAQGSLDYQLIMEMIVEKRQELIVKGAENFFLDKLYSSGGTVYNFADNVLKSVVDEKDQKVRTRKIMESTVNLVFTCAFTEYYLRTLKGKEKADFINFANSMKIKCSEKSPFGFSSFITETRKEGEYFSDADALNFIALLIDMSNEAIRQDSSLANLGLMKISYSATYEFMNKYNELLDKNTTVQDKMKLNGFEKAALGQEKEDVINKFLDTTVIGQNAVSAKHILADMKNKLRNITDYIGLLSYIKDQYSFRNKEDIFGLDKTAPDLSARSGQAITSLKNVQKKLKESIKRITVSAKRIDSVASHITELSKIVSYVQKSIVFLEKVKPKDSASWKIASDIIYTFNSEFVPILQKKSFLDTGLLAVIEHFSNITDSIASTIKNDQLINISGKMDKFLVLAAKLYQFDRASTISDYLKYIDAIGSVFPDDDIEDALSRVTTFVKDYTIIEDDGGQSVSFDVESFIMKLKDVKNEKSKRFQLLFTVGVNTSYFFLDSVRLPDTTVIRSFSNVSEKIGLKIKIWDRAFWRRFNPGETYTVAGIRRVKNAPPSEPVLTDVHALIYGSGILYNVFHTSTNRQFSFPMAGAGLGLTFFNGLVISGTVGIPIYQNDKNFFRSLKAPFVNFGMDVQFADYLKKLNEKRNNSKIQKAVNQAVQLK